MASFYFLMLASCVLAATSAQPECPQALACLNITAPSSEGDPCSVYSRPVTCLGELKDVCALDESVVTFDTVYKLTLQSCGPLRQNINLQCEDLGTCNSQTEFIQLLGAIADNPASIIDKLLDAGFWCHYLEQSSSCIITTASSCNVTAEGLRSVQALHQELTQACRGGEGGVCRP